MLTRLSGPVPSPSPAVYLFTIFTLQAWMKDRPKYQLKTLGNYHNLLLVYWSAAMVIGTLAEVARLVLLDGYTAYDVMCDNVDGGSLGAALTGRLGFWAWMYYVSKVKERLAHFVLLMTLSSSPSGDCFLCCGFSTTSFWTRFSWYKRDTQNAPPQTMASHSHTVMHQVLRKRPLTLLHVYHHCVIMFATWTWNVAGWTWHWYAIVVNCSVHVVMYSYCTSMCV